MPSFGFGYRFSRRRSFQAGNSVGGSEVLYGPNYGPLGPRKFLVSVWNQSPTGYCYETDSTQNLYAKWKSRGVNCLKHQHPDFSVRGEAGAVLAACQAEELMLLASPRWQTGLFGENAGALDYRDLAINNPYWRTNWIAYAFADEPDLYTLPQDDHAAFFTGHALSGVRKPGVVNFTWRIGSPSSPEGTESTNWRSFFQLDTVNEITHDTYTWHLSSSDVPVGSEDNRNGGYHLSTWNGYGPFNTVNNGTGLETPSKTMRGRRFTTSLVGMCVHLSRNGPMTRGRSDDNGVTVFPPHRFNNPPGVNGNIVLPEPLEYDPGDKSTGHYVAPGRVDFVSGSFQRGGLHSPARFLRDDIWSGIVHGSSHLLIFPQAPSGGPMVVTGYVDAATQRFIVTSTAPHGRNNINGAMGIARADNGAFVGWIRRDSFQVSGTANGAGTYALDNAKIATVTTGSAATPAQFRLQSGEGFSADGTNAANAAELTAATANIARMQAHPTGGNLLIDTAQGGRRPFTVLRCPDIDASPGLFKVDMTRAPQQTGYTAGGAPILDSANEGPMWPFGWPMGFEGFHVTGADGAVYIYVKSLSNGDAPTWFPGYAALGMPARAFGPFELAGFRRVGTSTAVEMTGTSGVIKAAQDDGAATWLYIETAEIAQNEGNSGTTAYNITVRRGGNLSGTNSVTATASGTGPNPANAADFVGGVFPSQVLSFAPNETTKVFVVSVTGDAAAEQNETFTVTLTAPSAGTVLVASGKNALACTITNDDAAVIGAFVWLGFSLTNATLPAASPPGATFLNVSETAPVTRSGITMRSRTAGITAADNFWFASTPGWSIANSFQGPDFVLPAGNWEAAFIATSASFGSGINGTVTMVDNPNGAANVRQARVLNSSGAASQALLMDTDGTAYTTATTAVADAINNLTYVPVTITSIGGGNGMLQVYANGFVIVAVALRQV